AHVGAGVHDRRVAGLRRDVARLAASDRVPVAHRDGTVIRATRDRHGRVVLLRSVDAIGELVVGDGVVELRGRLVVHAGPGGTAVQRHRGAAVVPFDHTARIARVDPQDVTVAVR